MTSSSKSRVLPPPGMRRASRWNRQVSAPAESKCASCFSLQPWLCLQPGLFAVGTQTLQHSVRATTKTFYRRGRKGRRGNKIILCVFDLALFLFSQDFRSAKAGLGRVIQMLHL